MKKHRFEHDYSASEEEVTKAIDAYVEQAHKRRRMVSTRPPVPDDLPEGVELPNDKQGAVAVFLRKGEGS
jgi:hypothetical protein